MDGLVKHAQHSQGDNKLLYIEAFKDGWPSKACTAQPG